MKPIIPLLLLVTHFVFPQDLEGLKEDTSNYLDQIKDELYATSDSIWEYSEPSFGEHRTVELLKTRLTQAGFTIEHAVAGFETMFIASYGSEGPVIGILAEADADSPLIHRKGFDLPNSEYGQAAGHHLLATGSLGAVLALKTLIEQDRIEAQIHYYFSTAEGSLGGRVPMANKRYFTELDLAFFWHPAPVTSANPSRWDAIIDMEFNFPNDRATPAQSVEFLKFLEVLKQDDDPNLALRYRIRHTQLDLSHSDNGLKIYLRITHTKQEKAIEIYNLILKKLADLRLDEAVTWNVFRAVHEFIPNLKGNQLAYANMIGLPVRKTIEIDKQLANNIWNASGKGKGKFLTQPLPLNEAIAAGLYGYGSDIGDVSWQVPLVSFVVSCIPTGMSMRNWEATAFGKSNYAKEGMLQAAKIMAATTLDYLSNLEVQKSIKSEFEGRLRNRNYFNSMEMVPNEYSRLKRSH
ncbi:hypothetical protein [Flagellimonas myxillae]|uniref:hypothetical protein n=1 Tax=Flagellimonas myxillae TaxID=2942214 RepID=UPI00201F246E|nr:hypothetical protein [Muricauda myxillae]MCL6265988.1 hypothetical protein [Muricauda myxillae]